MDERPNSLLTKSQREYLRGEKDYSPSTERKTRERIRDRTAAGVSDLKLLSDTLGPDDWDLIFADFAEYTGFHEKLEERERDDSPLHGARMRGDVHDRGRLMTRSLHGTAEFLYIALREHGGGLGAFEYVLETAIQNVETTRSERAQVDVEISIEYKPRPEELLDQLWAGEGLTEEEIQTLLEAGETEEISKLLIERGLKGMGSDDE